MRKIFNKVLAGITTVALVATLVVGVSATKNVKAEDTAVAISNWSFTQGGEYNPSEDGNEGYIGSVTMNGTNEVISGWLRTGEASVNQTQSATQASTGFAIQIDNTGWDAQWTAVTGYPTNRINPWSIQAANKNVAIKAGHIYTVSFKASATKKKFAYVAFASEIEGAAPYGDDVVEGSPSIITLNITEQEFTYTFTNWAEVENLHTTLMLGAFDAQYDYAGNNVSDIITAVENGWNGTVYVKDFKVVDKGVNPNYTPTPDRPTVAPPTVAPETQAPTQAPTVQAPTTQAPVVQTPAPTVKKLAKVKKVKAKNIGKGKVKITWKKVKNAKKYQVKVGTKKYTTKKAKLVVKKLKKGKKYTVRVRAMKRTGFKAGAWSKKVKVKVTK